MVMLVQKIALKETNVKKKSIAHEILFVTES